MSMKLGLTSIVIVSWNTRDVTLACIRSVQAHTPESHEIILVDNGSVDGSVEAFRGLVPAGIQLVELPRNLGYPGGVNRGLERVRGEWVCLLNSDTVVTKGWLRHLHEARIRHGAAMVGPCTNRAKGPQRHKPWWGRFPPAFRRSRDVDYLSFFCVMIERALLDRLGGLDERFGLGNFEDDDFCRRARDEGARLRIAGRAWVWHDAHATFKANGLDARAIQEANRPLFEEKWAKPSP
jgi:GT2 family glycosyltransferase